MGGPFTVIFEKMPFLKNFEFGIDPVAFTVFGRMIAWYGILICIGIILCYWHSSRKFKKEGMKSDDLLDYCLFTVPIGIIGARVFYVITDLKSYKTFGEMLEIWNGGLAITGGIVFGLITVLVVAKVKNHNCLVVLDAIAPGVLLAQAIGRWGNFFNGEVFGVETSLPFAMTLTDGIIVHSNVHPLFLYECFFNLVGVVIMNLLYRKKKYNGEIIFFYLAWYGLIRAWLETLRDPRYNMISPVFGGLFSRNICLIGGIAALVLFVVGFVLRKKKAWIFAEEPFARKAVPEAAEKEAAGEEKEDKEDNKDYAEDKAPEEPGEPVLDPEGPSLSDAGQDEAGGEDADNS